MVRNTLWQHLVVRGCHSVTSAAGVQRSRFLCANHTRRNLVAYSYATAFVRLYSVRSESPDSTDIDTGSTKGCLAISQECSIRILSNE